MASSDASSSAPSPDMAAPPATPSHFDRLPTELLKQIFVLEVITDNDSDSEESDPECTRGGGKQFSAWHGRGLHALSLLNKRLRELCLPFLCPVAKASQLDSALYRFGLVPQTMLKGVRRLDLHAASESAFVAAAIALPQLPNTTVLETSLRHQFLGQRRYRTSNAPRDLETKAFRGAVSRVSTLIIHGGEEARLTDEYISIFANIDTLRCVAFRNPGLSLFEFSDFNRPSAVRLYFLTTLPCLTHLDLSGANATEWANLLDDDELWPDEARFPALQCFKAKACCWLIFDFVAKAMPLVANLDVEFPVSAYDIADLASTPSLPSLEVLGITGSLRAASVVAQLDLPRLKSINLTILSSDDFATMYCTAMLPLNTLLPLQVAMRLTIPDTVTLEKADEFAALCKRLHLDLSWTPGNRLAVLVQPPTASAGDVYVRKAAKAVDDTLAWASERANRLRDLGDVVGLRELAELVKPLCERQIIEDM